MKNILILLVAVFTFGCAQQTISVLPEEQDAFVWSPETFADIKIVRYQIPGFDRLSLQQKKWVH